MTVFCNSDGCIHNCNGYCEMGDIWINEENVCEQFLYYADTPEYQSEFWKAIEFKNGERGRFKCKGMKLVINGRNFYTEDNYSYMKDYIALNDEKTGCRVPYKVLVYKWDSCLEKLEELPSVMTYPECAKITNEKGHAEFVIKGSE